MAKKRTKSSRQGQPNPAKEIAEPQPPTSKSASKSAPKSAPLQPQPPKPRPPKIITAELITAATELDPQQDSDPTNPLTPNSNAGPNSTPSPNSTPATPQTVVIPPELVSSELPKPSILRRKTAQALRGASKSLGAAADQLESSSWLGQLWHRLLQPLRSWIPGGLKSISDEAIAYSLLSVVLVGMTAGIALFAPTAAQEGNPTALQQPAPVGPSEVPGSSPTSPEAPENQSPDAKSPDAKPTEDNDPEAPSSPNQPLPDQAPIATADQDSQQPLAPLPQIAPPEPRQLISLLGLDPEEITPPQELQIALEQKLIDLFSDPDLLLSVQPSYRSSHLQMRLSRAWFELSPEQQDHLTAQVLQRAHRLDFIHLNLQDSQGHLIARDSATEPGYVVLQRQQKPPDSRT